MEPSAPTSRLKSPINQNPMKRILFLLLICISAISALGQTPAPFGQYDVIFKVNNIYTTAHTDGNCPNYFRFFLEAPPSTIGLQDVWDVLTGIGTSPTSWTGTYTTRANIPPRMPLFFNVQEGRNWNAGTFGGGCT